MTLTFDLIPSKCNGHLGSFSVWVINRKEHSLSVFIQCVYHSWEKKKKQQYIRCKMGFDCPETKSDSWFLSSSKMMLRHHLEHYVHSFKMIIWVHIYEIMWASYWYHMDFVSWHQVDIISSYKTFNFWLSKTSFILMLCPQ